MEASAPARAGTRRTACFLRRRATETAPETNEGRLGGDAGDQQKEEKGAAGRSTMAALYSTTLLDATPLLSLRP